MASQLKCATSLLQNLPTKSTFLHTLKPDAGNSSKIIPKECSQHVRQITHDSSTPQNPKVDDWSNGLRETLLSNLSPGCVGKTKLVPTNKGLAKEVIPAFKFVDQSLTGDKFVEGDNTRLADAVVSQTSNAPEMEAQRGRYLGESNSGAVLQKTVDLNMGDMMMENREKKKLSMDINVVVNIKPYEHERKIGFQEVSSRKKCVDNNVKQSEGNGKLSISNQPEVRMNVENTSSLSSIVSEETKLPSRDFLIREFGKVYAQYLNNRRPTSEEMNNEIPEVLRKSISKVSEIYLRSLQSVESEVPPKPPSVPGNTTQNMTTGSGTSLELNTESQPPLDISNTVGTGSSRRLIGRLLTPFRSFGSPRRTFVTSAARHAQKEKKKDDCDSAKRLPCLQASELSKAKAENVGNKSVCEKFCMPCCKPARDPPECFYPYHKPNCERHKPPRPSFSECKTLFSLKQIQPCECIRPRGTTCKKSKESKKCAK